MIRLLLADDQALVRGALSALLGLEPDLEVVAEVSSGDAVVPAVLQHRPDVALLDVEMLPMLGAHFPHDIVGLWHRAASGQDRVSIFSEAWNEGIRGTPPTLPLRPLSQSALTASLAEYRPVRVNHPAPESRRPQSRRRGR